MSLKSNRSSWVLVPSLAVALAGCPMEDDPPASTAPDAGTGPAADAGASPDASARIDDAGPAAQTHSGLVSIQDIAIANLPAAGHGLTVNAFFTPFATPDFDSTAGSDSGCRAWSYDLATRPPPPDQDHGELRIDGAKNGPLACRFVAGRGYACPTATGSAAVVVGAPTGGAAPATVPGASFTAADVGRYLQRGGAAGAANNGAFAIVAAISASEVVVANPRATAESFAATYTLLADAGPTPSDLYDPFPAGTKITVGFVPGASSAFDIPATSITPGGAFVLDEASKVGIMNVPVTGAAFSLGCASCGAAEATVVRITATDADVSTASPVAMPPPRKKLVEIQCVIAGAGAESVTVPAAAMDLLRASHASSPVTRIRTAFMRDGLAVLKNVRPRPPNTAYLVSGHGVLGFTKP